MLTESDMTQTVETNNIAELISSSMKANRTSGGGRGKSDKASQQDVLGVDGLQFIQSSMKGNKSTGVKGQSVSAEDFVENIGSEYFRWENADLTLRNKSNSAKSFTKVTITDLDLRTVGGEIVRLSEIILSGDLSILTEKKVVGFGEVHIINEQFACEWPLGDATSVTVGDPVATQIAPYLAPWSLFIEAMELFANKQ